MAGILPKITEDDEEEAGIPNQRYNVQHVLEY